MRLQQIKFLDRKTPHRKTQKVPWPVEMDLAPSSPSLHRLAITADWMTRSKKGEMNLRKRKMGTKKITQTKQRCSGVSSCQRSDWRLGRLHLIRLREEWPHQAGPGEAAGWQSLGLDWGWNLVKRGLTVQTWRTSALDKWKKRWRATWFSFIWPFLSALGEGEITQPSLITWSCLDKWLCVSRVVILFSPGGDPIAKLSSSWSQRWTRRVTMSGGFKQTQTFVTPIARRMRSSTYQ